MPSVVIKMALAQLANGLNSGAEHYLNGSGNLHELCTVLKLSSENMKTQAVCLSDPILEEIGGAQGLRSMRLNQVNILM